MALCGDEVAYDLCGGGRVVYGRVACGATLVALASGVSRLGGSRRATTDGSNYCVHLQPGIAVRQGNTAIELRDVATSPHLVVTSKHLFVVERAQYRGCNEHLIEQQKLLLCVLQL